MNYVTNDFARAYQAELLRTAEKIHNEQLLSLVEVSSWRSFQIRLGDALIALGAWIKGESACTEMSHSQP